MNLQILYENDDLLVIDKPAGLIVHPDGKTKEASVCDFIMEHYPELENIGEPAEYTPGVILKRPGIVHRIDRDTSGVLVIAKTQESFEYLKKQFQERKVHKTYNAFVYGHFKEPEGIIDRPIGKSRNDFRLWTAQRGARGKLRDAVTQYHVLKEGVWGSEKVAFVEAYPRTGRTHQLRVHFKAINHEIVCDELYAPKKKCLLGFSRVALHAERIRFVDARGVILDVQAPLPDDFREALSLIDPKNQEK